MRVMGRYLLFLWVAMAPQLLAGTIYFVATNGNDTHNGLYPSYMGETNGPFRTLNRAASKLQAGDTLEIRGGTYAEKVNFSNNGTAADRITIKNYDHENVIIDGQYTLPGGSVYYFLVVVSGDYVTLSNITIKRSSGGLLSLTGDYTYAINVIGDGSRENGMVATGNYDLFDGCTMTDNGNGYNPPVQNTWGSAISVDVGSNSTIQNCLSYNNRGEGLCVGRLTTNAVIQDCISYDNEALQIYIVSSTGTIVRRNIIYCSGGAKYGPSPGIVIGDEYGTGLANLQIVNNLCVGNFLNFVSDSNVKKASGWTIAYNSFVNTQKTQAQIEVGYNMNVYFRPDLVDFSNSLFKNNIIVEEAGNQVPINATLTNPHAGFTFSNNSWNKTPTAAALGTGDVIGDPLLAKTGPTGAGLLTPAYFKILANSPARDKAAVLSEVTEDFFKTARGNAPDIGAHEFVNAGSSIVDLAIAAETGTPAPGTGGTTDPSPGKYSYSMGSTVVLKSIPNADYRFSRWTGDVMAVAAFYPANTLVMDTSKSLSATFCVKCADVNGDLIVTPGDAQLAFDIYLEKIAEPTWCQLENADVNGDGTKLSPKVTPADAQSIFLHYLNGGTIGGDCSGSSRLEALSTQSLGYADVSLTINDVAFASGQDVLVPVIIDSPSDIRAFGFDLAFPSEFLTFIGVERTDLTKEFDQLDAVVISQERSQGERGAAFRKGSRILRVGGYKTHSRQEPSSGVLVTLIFRATRPSPDQAPLTIIATYDDFQNASIKTDSSPGRVRRPASPGLTQPSPRRRS